MQVLLSTGLFLAAFASLFWPAITGMVHDWDIDPNYSHGFLVPAISAYLAWQKRDQLAKLRATRCSLGLLVVIGGLLSMGTLIWRASRPHIAVLGRIPNSGHFRNVERYEAQALPGSTMIWVSNSLPWWKDGNL